MLRQKVTEVVLKKELLETLKCTHSYIHETSDYPETLTITDNRQYVSMGLTYINDGLYELFAKLEQSRVDLVNK